MNGRRAVSHRELALLAAGAAVFATLASPAHATTSGAITPGTYALKDGVLMETRDGRVVAMKEDLNWKQLHQFGTLSPKTR